MPLHLEEEARLCHIGVMSADTQAQLGPAPQLSPLPITLICLGASRFRRSQSSRESAPARGSRADWGARDQPAACSAHLPRSDV